MTYFKDCTTIDQVKTLYRSLAKQNHPDTGGDLATMQRVNIEYAFIVAKLAKATPGATAQDIENEILQSEAYQQAINSIISLEGINIELCGGWVWVTGNTRPYASEKSGGNGTLPGAGFFYAKKKVAWYFRTAEFKTRGKSTLSMDGIRHKYGTQSIAQKSFLKIN